MIVTRRNFTNEPRILYEDYLRLAQLSESPPLLLLPGQFLMTGLAVTDVEPTDFSDTSDHRPSQSWLASQAGTKPLAGTVSYASVE